MGIEVGWEGGREGGEREGRDGVGEEDVRVRSVVLLAQRSMPLRSDSLPRRHPSVGGRTVNVLDPLTTA